MNLNFSKDGGKMKKAKQFATVLVVASIILCAVGCANETVPPHEVPEMVFVKGGTIEGAEYTNKYEGVFIEGRTVTLSDFYMGKYEVTQEEYASVMAGQKVTVEGVEYTLESNPNYCTKDSTEYTLFSGDVQEKRPVEGVTWYDAVWYCNALSEKEGLTKAYNIEVTQVKQASGKTGYYIYEANVTLNKNANGYRLPTEAEWEYAARGGDQKADDWNYVFSGADTPEGVSCSSIINSGLDSVGWYSKNSINGTTGDTSPSSGEQGFGTHQVGKKAPNRLGLYDMSGNVSEWCYDWDGTVDNETPVDGATSGSQRVSRGGNWCNYANFASVSCRYDSYYPYIPRHGYGFRVVRPVLQSRKLPPAIFYSARIFWRKFLLGNNRPSVADFIDRIRNLRPVIFQSARIFWRKFSLSYNRPSVADFIDMIRKLHSAIFYSSRIS